jgi:CRP-like cAMP-binding protein
MDGFSRDVSPGDFNGMAGSGSDIEGQGLVSAAVRNAGDRVQNFLKRVHLFSVWPAPLIEKLAADSELYRYTDGEVAIPRAVNSSRLGIVVSGSFVAQRPRADGDAMIADYLMPGQAIAYLSVLDGFPPLFDVVASGESEMLMIARKTLLDIFAADPARYSDFVLMLCRRLRREHENTYMRTTNSVRCQLARVILYWARGQMGAGKSARIPVGISQEDIAAMLGKSRPTINKEIGALISEGVLARSYRQIQVLDVQALIDIADRENPGTTKMNEAIFAKPSGILMTSD